MYLSSTRPTSVQSSFTCNFTSPTDLNLIINKQNHFEIYLYQDQLEFYCTVPIHGRISQMISYRPASSDTDWIFVTTQSQMFSLSFENQIIKNHYIHTDITTSKHLMWNGQFIAVYTGLLKIINHSDAVTVALDKLDIVDMLFVGLDLYILSKNTLDLYSYKDSTLEPVNSRPLSDGIVVVSEQIVTFLNSSVTTTIAISPTVMKCFCNIDDYRFLLADHLGNLFILVLLQNGSTLKIDLLGTTVLASCLSYLSHGHVFVGSHFGDSELILLTPDKLQLVTTFTNIAPVTDFCLVDIDNHGQGQLVTCSGAYKDGSLRIIHSGIGVEDLASLNLRGLVSVWSSDNHIFLSFVSGTVVLMHSNNKLFSIPSDFSLDESSICCGSIQNYLVQVTCNNVYLIDSSMKLIFKYSRKIANASIGTDKILIAAGSVLRCLTVKDRKLVETVHFEMPFEISSIDVGRGKLQDLCVVTLWDNSLRLVSLIRKKEVFSDYLSQGICRSVVLATIGSLNYVLAGMGDGTLYYYVLESNKLRHKKEVLIGTLPVHLKLFTSNNSEHIFASCDKPTVIFARLDKLQCSHVNQSNITNVAQFKFNGNHGLAMVCDDQLKFGVIETIQKLHIKKIHMGATVRRITYNEQSKTFGILLRRLDETSEFQVLDGRTYARLYVYQFPKDEYAWSIQSMVFENDPNMYFVVGTGFCHANEDEPQNGRIVVFSNNQVKTFVDIPGCAYNVNIVQGKLVAGVNSKLILYEWENETLVPLYTHFGHVVAFAVAVERDRVIVGDLIKSVTSLKLENNKLIEQARHYESSWLTAVECMNENTFIGADNYFNIFCLKQMADSPKLMEYANFHQGDLINKFKRGQMNMRIENSNIQPKLLFCTVNGAIGTISELTSEYYEILSTLQTHMQSQQGVGGLKHDDFRQFKTVSQSKPMSMSIDGDFVETFVDMPSDVQQQIANDMNTQLNDILNVIEECMRIH